MPTPSQSLTLRRGPRWRNRVALAPLTNLQSNADGTLTDDEHDWLARRADGGFGMVMTCAAFVDDAGHSFTGQLGASDDAHLPGLTRLADSLRAAGAASSVQLQHGGRRGDRALTSTLVAPWDDPKYGAQALTTDGVQQVIADFAAAARRVERAGFDGVEIHGAHGYLLAQFLDGRNNVRTDRYGGSADNRFAIIHETIAAVRAATGADFQVGLRLSPERYGIVLDEARELARQVLADGAVDYLDMSMWDTFKHPHDRESHDRPLLDYFTEIPRGDVRLGVAGKILSSAQVHECLDRGVDFVLAGTAGILHHDFPRLVVDDLDFTATHPQPASHFIAESVGPAFLDYLATNWDDFVTAGDAT
ncbi:putative NADH-dependent flavin oxidoreductase YqiG [Gordonia spumicola]|uniref:Putative NADH-dependent flavin oxidoreductase YqiG n=1 Tax=Gordonia spumicola TaxID=589161 RepID=A0A7I9VCE1_9ACTN|nr:NADH:flavin oxidoreductase [Gordonia spumicola]GEE03036.1 putative NADH-dependent flavin oxidoreductase YqiG [Gordonia spumicola]